VISTAAHVSNPAITCLELFCSFHFPITRPYSQCSSLRSQPGELSCPAHFSPKDYILFNVTQLFLSPDKTSVVPHQDTSFNDLNLAHAANLKPVSVFIHKDAHQLLFILLSVVNAVPATACHDF
jgi:hypothetical protein